MAWSRESRHARGYGTSWDKLRKVILARDHWLCQCAECAKLMVPKPATEVNHKVSKADARRMGWTEEKIDAESNLEAVNRECHKRITAIQNGAKPRPRIGADGWPAPD